MGVGGTARVLVSPRSPTELRQALEICHQQSLPVYVLGAGSNVLVRDEGLPAAVFRLPVPGVRALRLRGRRIRVAAGFRLPRLVGRAVALGLSGLEGLAGVPGTLGGAIACNAGTRYRQMGELVEQLTVMTHQGEERILARDELKFGYRESNLDGGIVLEAVLKLTPGSVDRIRREFARILEAKYSSQPVRDRSAGCVFKNPPGHAAGELIERVGLKGKVQGGAQISSRHANFIINRGHASAQDVLTLIDLARQEVRRVLGIELELEIDLWPRNGR